MRMRRPQMARCAATMASQATTTMTRMCSPEAMTPPDPFRWVAPNISCNPLVGAPYGLRLVPPSGNESSA